MEELAEIVFLRNRSYKDNWITDSLFLMVGYMFCIYGGISSLEVNLVTLEQWLGNLSIGQIQILSPLPISLNSNFLGIDPRNLFF